MNHAGCLPSARAADRSAGALLCLPALGQGSRGTAKFPDPKDAAAYVQGKMLLHCITSDVPVRPPKRLQETYSMTENETTESEKYRLCVSAQLKTVSACLASVSCSLQ